MKITKRQLRRIIKEVHEMSREAVEDYLIHKAKGYHEDKMLVRSGPGAIRELLLDDLLDNVAGSWSPQEFASLIDELSKASPEEPAFRGPDPSTHRRLRQQTRAQGGYTGRGAWKSRTASV